MTKACQFDAQTCIAVADVWVLMRNGSHYYYRSIHICGCIYTYMLTSNSMNNGTLINDPEPKVMNNTFTYTNLFLLCFYLCICFFQCNLLGIKEFDTTLSTDIYLSHQCDLQKDFLITSRNYE